MEAPLGLPVRGCSEPTARPEAPFPAEAALSRHDPGLTLTQQALGNAVKVKAQSKSGFLSQAEGNASTFC